MTHEFTSSLRPQSFTHGYRSKAPRNSSTVVIGDGRTHARIYKLARKDGYESHQCIWYEFGKRQSKTFADLEAAKFFAQQKVEALLSGRVPHDTVRYRDIEMLRDCETRAKQHGASLVTAIEEWAAARHLLGKRSIIEAARIYIERHANIPEVTFAQAADQFAEAKAAAGLSEVYLRKLRYHFHTLKAFLGRLNLGDITVQQLDRMLCTLKVSPVSKNNVRRALVTFFRWAQAQDYLQSDRKTVAERTMTFAVTDTAPAIFTPAEMQKILAEGPDNLLPHMVIGALSGIRAAEIERLEWSEILWDRGYIEIKAAKAKTKARRLVPILPNLRAWLEPMKKEQGRVCFLRNLHLRLTYFGEKSGVGWKQNALRHSFASYRLAEIQDAAKVALEMGNTPDKLFRHYRELVTPEAAKEWFAIMPRTSRPDVAA